MTFAFVHQPLGVMLAYAPIDSLAIIIIVHFLALMTRSMLVWRLSSSLVLTVSFQIQLAKHPTQWWCVGLKCFLGLAGGCAMGDQSSFEAFCSDEMRKKNTLVSHKRRQLLSHKWSRILYRPTPADLIKKKKAFLDWFSEKVLWCPSKNGGLYNWKTSTAKPFLLSWRAFYSLYDVFDSHYF